jgi:hypothetical protein
VSGSDNAGVDVVLGEMYLPDVQDIETVEADPSGRRYLYINSFPHYAKAVHLDRIMVPYFDAIAREADVHHHFQVKGYNESAKRAGALLLAHVKSGKGTIPNHVIADRRSPSTDAIIEAIKPLFNEIIEKF